MDRKALIFLHIPKTAGTTLNRIVDCQYSPLEIFTIDPHRIKASSERLNGRRRSGAVACVWCAAICLTAFTSACRKELPT